MMFLETVKDAVQAWWNAVGKKTLIVLVILHLMMLMIYYGFGLKGYVLGFDIQCIEIALWCGYSAYVINKWCADNKENEEFKDILFPCEIIKWVCIWAVIGVCITVIPMMIKRAMSGLFFMPWP